MTVYSVTDWGELYENHETRKRKSLFWVLVPNSHDSLGFVEIMERDDGLEVFGAWNLILQVASKCPVRGLLANAKGRPYTAKEIAKKTRAEAEQIENALEVLTEIGWIHAEDAADHAGTSARHAATSADHAAMSADRAATSGSKKERKKEKEERPPLIPPRGDEGEGGEMPSALKSKKFGDVWARWLAYHEEQGRPLAPTRAQQQLEDLATRGEAAAIEAIVTALMRGWQSPAKTDKAAKSEGRELDQRIESRRAEMADAVNASAELLKAAQSGATS